MLAHTSPGITNTPWLLATAVAVAVAAAALAGSPATAQEDDAVVPTRVDGQSRIHTGAKHRHAHVRPGRRGPHRQRQRLP